MKKVPAFGQAHSLCSSQRFLSYLDLIHPRSDVEEAAF